MPTHPPNWIPLIGEDMEVLLAQLQRGNSAQAEVGPTLDKLDDRLEGVESQAVISIVAEVSHEDADLWVRMMWILLLLLSLLQQTTDGMGGVWVP